MDCRTPPVQPTRLPWRWTGLVRWLGVEDLHLVDVGLELELHQLSGVGPERDPLDRNQSLL